MKILLPLFYLPPISWFSVFLQEDTDIVFEQFESFPKQTYRNRTAIYGANGKLLLIIPVKHDGNRTINKIEVSHRDNWEKNHWKYIKTAYKLSLIHISITNYLCTCNKTHKKQTNNLNIYQ